MTSFTHIHRTNSEKSLCLPTKAPLQSYPIAFINDYLYFLLQSSPFLSLADDLCKSIYLRVWFHFDKVGTGNLQERIFHHFLPERSFFCPLLAVLFAMDHWTSYNIDPLTLIFWYRKMKVVTFLHDYVVTKNLREATLHVYLNPNHLSTYILKMSAHTQSELSHVSSFVVAKLSYAITKHRLFWVSSLWKVYIREIRAYTSSLYTALGNQSANPDGAYNLQAYYGNNNL